MYFYKYKHWFYYLVLYPSQSDIGSNFSNYGDDKNINMCMENSDSSFYNSACNIDDDQFSTTSETSLNLDTPMDHLIFTTPKHKTLERPKSLDVLTYLTSETTVKNLSSSSEANVSLM